MKTTIFRTDYIINTRYLVAFVTLVICNMNTTAQTNIVHSPMVHTLQVIANDDWMQTPAVMVLDSEDFVTLSFDYFSHEYHRIACHIIHCNADWNPSDLNENEYLEGFNDRPIDFYEKSLNTTFLYTHYAVDYPNDDARLKVSGNYKVLFYDEESDVSVLPNQPQYKGCPVIAEGCFRVVEPLVTVSAEVTSNTDIDTHEANQQVSFIINHDGYAIDRPESEIKIFVSQNDRPDMTATDIRPTYINPGRLEYTHNRSLIFPGNNEFRRFEVINMHYGSQNVDDISFFDPYFHAVLLPDVDRRAYSFDADHNGRFLVRYNLAEDQNTEADYLFVHFTLQVPHPLSGGRLYLAGRFSDYRYTPEYQLTYNLEKSCYEGTALLKMGAYDYQYIFVPDNNTSKLSMPNPYDGTFYETENEYTISVYHRPFGDRYDHLIAVEAVAFGQE